MGLDNILYTSQPVQYKKLSSALENLFRGSFKNGDNITFYEVCDPTAEQFDIEPPHWEGRSCGFQTKHLSKRAESLLSSVLYERLSNNIADEGVDNHESN